MGAVTHLSLGGSSVACGAETSWRSRGKLFTDLKQPKNADDVTCRRCKWTWRFAAIPTQRA